MQTANWTPEPQTRLLYAQDDFPVFQNRMYETAEAAQNCAKGNIRLVEDLQSGLVYNAAFDPALVVYDERYQNEQSLSPSFQAHLDYVADLVTRHLGRRNLVEIGCGKGHFLEMLQARGAGIVGFDPTYEGTNPVIRKVNYTGMQAADGLILRHVLEHIQDPYAFLSDIRGSNGGGGLIYIEVPCFDWICSHKAWFDVFYEHANYFRLDDFFRMFGDIIHAERSFDGQYLSVTADLGSLVAPAYREGQCVDFPKGFSAALDRVGFGDLTVWGGASKGVIFSLMCMRRGHKVQRVIDINPAKQGQYLAATGIRVSSPDEAMEALGDGARIVIMNSNYSAEIREMTENRFTYIEIDNV